MPRTKAGFNFDGSLSFFDRVVFPAAAQAHGGKLQQLLGTNVAATTRNLGFQGSEIDRQQRRSEIEAADTKSFDEVEKRFNAISNVQDQLLGRPASTGPGAVDNLQREIRGVPGSQLPVHGDGPVAGVEGSFAPQGSLQVDNPFAAQAPGSTPGREGFDLGTKQQQQFAGTVQAKSKANTQKAATKWLALSKAAKNLPAYRLKQANEQFAQEFPDFAAMNPIRHVTPEEAKQVQDTMKLTKAQSKFDEFATSQGIPPIPLVLNANGEAEAPAWWNAHQQTVVKAKAETSKLKVEQMQLKERMYEQAISGKRAEVQQTLSLKNPFSLQDQPAEWFDFNNSQRAAVAEGNTFGAEARKRIFPEEFGTPPTMPISRQQMAESRQIAIANGVPQENVVSSPEDMDLFQKQANQSGEWVRVVDSSTNKLEWIAPQK